MTKDEALKLALSALNEVREETFRLMRNGQTLYAEKKVWMAIYTIKKVLAQPQRTWVDGELIGVLKHCEDLLREDGHEDAVDDVQNMIAKIKARGQA